MFAGRRTRPSLTESDYSGLTLGLWYSLSEVPRIWLTKNFTKG